MDNPKFMKNQIWNEIKMSNQTLPVVSIFLTPFLLLEVRGYAKLYDTTADGPGWWYNTLQIPLFFLFSDYWTYWIHRLYHHRRVYSHFLCMHKLHHRFIIPTPYASQAGHPSEFISLPLAYIIFPLILPLQKVVHIVLIVVITPWNIVIHNGNFVINNSILCTSASHTLHHIYRNCNYSQYFTIFDRLHGTYRKPENWMFQENKR